MMDRILDAIKELEDCDFHKNSVRNPIYELAKKYPGAFIDVFQAGSAKNILDNYLIGLSKTNGKIPCIKACRVVTDCGLKEAKQYVEELIGYDHNLYGNSTGWNSNDESERIKLKIKDLGGVSL